MKGRTRSRSGGRFGRGDPPLGGRRSRARALWLGATGAAAVALVAFLLQSRPRGMGQGLHRAPPVHGENAVLDSVRAADARKDWVAGLVWSERLGAFRPRDSGVLLARGTAWSNFAIGARPSRAIPRPAVRTSLERTACQIRALGLTDSAAMLARDEREWMEAVQHLGQLQEVQGLPGDALLAYELMRRRRTDEPVGMLRATWLRAMLRDPIHPDTTLYDRRMRQMRLR